ncbi:hypothetical protein FIBSPDRAFT_870962 [Athelia psychrophila]|uniref:Uncharacterized protein n=1 Tax=Athelia psychrophila TaxID=1759441 RepID=A0A166AP75_9AGAM|nr:hypothetical protein FIBSPDRAFT_870962 [Fibularhizoctonia sp. CBS 109695]
MGLDAQMPPIRALLFSREHYDVLAMCWSRDDHAQPLPRTCLATGSLSDCFPPQIGIMHSLCSVLDPLANHGHL